MYFYKRLSVSPSISDPEAAKRDLQRERGHLLLYVIMLSPGSAEKGGNQIEFCHSAVLQQPYYRHYPPVIIGLAQGRKECMDLVAQIVQDTYAHTGGADIRSYLFPEGINAGITVGGRK